MNINCNYFDDESLKVLYENKDFLQLYFNSFDLCQLLITLAGEKPAYFERLPANFSARKISPVKRKYYNFDSGSYDRLTQILDTFDVEYASRVEESTDNLGTHNSYISILIASDDNLTTTEDMRSFEDKSQSLSHERLGAILGYPESSINQFMSDENISRSKTVNLYYDAIQDLTVDELPTVDKRKEIPLVYLKSVVVQSPCPPEDLDFYKWDIKRYLNLLDFSRTMSNVFGSNHIKSWDILNKTHKYKLTDPNEGTATISDNFRKLQEEYVKYARGQGPELR